LFSNKPPINTNIQKSINIKKKLRPVNILSNCTKNNNPTIKRKPTELNDILENENVKNTIERRLKQMNKLDDTVYNNPTEKDKKPSLGIIDEQPIIKKNIGMNLGNIFDVDFQPVPSSSPNNNEIEDEIKKLQELREKQIGRDKRTK